MIFITQPQTYYFSIPERVPEYFYCGEFRFSFVAEDSLWNRPARYVSDSELVREYIDMLCLRDYELAVGEAVH